MYAKKNSKKTKETSKRASNAETHGMRRTRIYSIWTNLKTRTGNKKNPSYKNYGGRGVKCLWVSFAEFYRDMGSTYKERLTIERIDVNGHYSKENCRWIPFSEQQSNTQKSVKHNGETMAQAERRLGLQRGTIFMRLKKGWTKDRAFKEKKYEQRIY